MEGGQTLTALLPLQPDSEVAEAGRCLEVFFEGWLKEIYPEKRFAQPRQEDSDSEEESGESGNSTPQGFPWPHYMQEGIQPKRRRRHMVRRCCQLAGRWVGDWAGRGHPRSMYRVTGSEAAQVAQESGDNEPSLATP